MKANINLNDYMAKPNRTIEQHNNDLLIELNILKEFGYIKNEQIYNLMCKAIYYHDIGKANNEFQIRVKSNDKIKFDKGKEITHNILSFCFIDKNEFDNEQDFESVAHAVLHHHNYGDIHNTVSTSSDLINHLLEPFSVKKPKPSFFRKFCDSKVLNNYDNILIKGLLHKCDYSASANYEIEYRNDFLLDNLNNLGYKWNELQEFCINNRDNNIIAIASTGAGKTEAGLLWLSNNKSFFILPVRTAINAMYDRIKKNVLRNENIEERLSVLHSSSLDYYNKNSIVDNEMLKTDVDLIEYENRGKRLSIPLNISTMDQLFDFVFKYDGFELKLATLSYSKIVIDEIQMYDSKLLAYLICGINYIIQMGGKVAIVTATLPPFIYDLLNDENNRFIRKNFISDTKNEKTRHNVKIVDNTINSQNIIDKYIENSNQNKSNKILVVCNTVKVAQEIYEELKTSNLFTNDELNILHSKFIKKERFVKEKQITEFGQTFNNGVIDNRKGIWISTSLVEASLDIDFDYLFTELQDLSSLFQRLGRVNRKGVKDTSEYNCFIYTKINTRLLKSVNSNNGFIDLEIFNLSKEALSEVDGLLSEQDKLKLIDTYLTTDNLIDSCYLQNYKTIYKKIKDINAYVESKEDIKLRDILSESIIPQPVYYKNKDIIDTLVNKYNQCISDIKTSKKLSYENTENSKRDTRKLELKRNSLYSSIDDYTVSIENNIIYASIYNTKATKFSDIVLDDKRRFKIIDCIYDEKGFSPIKKDTNTEPVFL